MNVDSGLHAGNDRKRAFFLAKIILVRLHDDQNDAKNTTANGRSATNSAEAPESVLRTT